MSKKSKAKRLSLMVEIIFDIEGNIPPKKNSRINTRSGRSFPNKRYTEWLRLAGQQVREQSRHVKNVILPIDKCESVTCILYYSELRRKDNSNTVESIHDMLVDFGVLKDDCWQVTGMTSQIPVYRKGLPGAKIIIHPNAQVLTVID